MTLITQPYEHIAKYVAKHMTTGLQIKDIQTLVFLRMLWTKPRLTRTMIIEGMMQTAD
jgi:hypothetical protein